MLQFLLAFLIMSSLYSLSTSRLGALINVIGFQGLLVGLIPLLVSGSLAEPHTWILAAIGLIVKGIVIPLMLFKVIRGITINRELEPYIGYPLSIVSGVLIVIGAYECHHLVSENPLFSSDLIPSAITVAVCGLFLVIARKKALTQVIGYLSFENGIYLFGISISVKSPMLVELGILLDVLVGVFVMGIVVYHIHQEFDTISTQNLGALRE